FDLKVQEMQKQIDIQQEADQKKERILLRLKYLQPLRAETEEFGKRMAEINISISDPQELTKVKRWFGFIRDNSQLARKEFLLWCNYEGHFAMTTLYTTAKYLAHAGRILSTEPFRELNTAYSNELKEHLEKVRAALGGSYNVWEKSQDIIGHCVTRGDTVASYRE